MFSHYLSTAMRQFRRHKVTTTINVFCLALGLICFMLAWGIAAYFGRGDEYHARSARTFLITNKAHVVNLTMNTTPWLLSEHLRADFPQLEAVARVKGFQEIPVTVGGVSSFAAVAYADPEFLRIFDLPFIAGERTSALDEPRSAIISEELAMRLFGSREVVGRTMRPSGSEFEVRITGVIGPIPQPSHLYTNGAFGPLGVSFEAILSMDMYVSPSANQRWGWQCCYTYVVLSEDGSLGHAELNQQLDAFAERNVSAESRGKLQFRARPIGEFVEIAMNMMVGTDKTGLSSITLLELLGGLVLLVACLNYANLATAQTTVRAKEVAMRRVVGANRRQVALQHLFEGSLLTCAALLVASACIGSVLWSVGSATTLGILWLFLSMPKFWVLLIALILFVSFVGGAYPALVLSSIRPAHALRAARVRSGPRLVATLLVGVQFASASFLLIAAFVVMAQNTEMKRVALNPDNDPVVIVTNDTTAAGVDRQLLKSELLRTSRVSAVSGINRVPWSPGANMTQVTRTSEAAAAEQNANVAIVDYDFFETLQIGLIAGRRFHREAGGDVADVVAWQRPGGAAASEYHVVIEPRLAQSLGLGTPSEAIGKVFYRPTSRDGSTPPHRLRVIGVVEEASVMPLNLGYSVFYMLNPAAATVPVIRLSKRDVPEALAAIDETWAALAPEVPLKRRFGDEQFERSFRFLNVISSGFTALAGFASVIATTGLVGMALHVTRRRIHEIGVRKTLGAGVGQILWMLLKSFSKPVVIANLAVWPLVYVVMTGYLNLFAHRAGLTPLPFLAVLTLTVVIAWCAVAAQATRAARLKPATVLRYE